MHHTKRKVMEMLEIKFISLTYSDGTKTYVKADTIVQLVEGQGCTFVYTVNDGSPMAVKESMDEIVHNLLTL